MEPRKNVLTVCKGEYFEISMITNAASTGYDWGISKIEGPILFLGEYNQSVRSGNAGAPYKKIFNVIAIETGNASIEFKLVRPWNPQEVVVVNYYEIKIEDSHTQDELKQFINEDNFPKTPILKYGFIPTSSYSVQEGLQGNYKNQENGQVISNTYGKPLMPYGVYSPNQENDSDQDLRLVEVHENDSRCLLKYGSPDPFNLNQSKSCNVKYGFMLDISKLK